MAIGRPDQPSAPQMRSKEICFEPEHHGRSSPCRPVRLASPVGGHRAAVTRGEGSAAPRAWYIDVAEAAKALELASLKAENYREKIDLLVRRVDAYDRFSERC